MEPVLIYRERWVTACDLGHGTQLTVLRVCRLATQLILSHFLKYLHRCLQLLGLGSLASSGPQWTSFCSLRK